LGFWGRSRALRMLTSSCRRRQSETRRARSDSRRDSRSFRDRDKTRTVSLRLLLRSTAIVAGTCGVLRLRERGSWSTTAAIAQKWAGSLTAYCCILDAIYLTISDSRNCASGGRARRQCDINRSRVFWTRIFPISSDRFGLLHDVK
jgi:hypothetical protein